MEKQIKKKRGEETPKKAVEKPKENVVFIGRKPLINYVVACLTFFNAGEEEIVVKARGRAISTAVDTVELLKRGFLKNLEVKSIEIDTEEIASFEGQRRNVSTIDIKLTKSD